MEAFLLYSIGYQYMKEPAELVAALRRYEIGVLVDVRSKPYGRKYAFNRKALETLLPSAGIGYVWKGDVLGGFASISEEAIKGLAAWQRDRVACLMCMEKDPDRCHRKNEIARRLLSYGVEVLHLPLQPAANQRSLFP